jgi:hypothetical protein
VYGIHVESRSPRSPPKPRRPPVRPSNPYKAWPSSKGGALPQLSGVVRWSPSTRESDNCRNGKDDDKYHSPSRDGILLFMSLFGCVYPPPLFASPIRSLGSSVVNSKLRTGCAGRSSLARCYISMYSTVKRCSGCLTVGQETVMLTPYSFSLAFFQRTC